MRRDGHRNRSWALTNAPPGVEAGTRCRAPATPMAGHRRRGAGSIARGQRVRANPLSAERMGKAVRPPAVRSSPRYDGNTRGPVRQRRMAASKPHGARSGRRPQRGRYMAVCGTVPARGRPRRRCSAAVRPSTDRRRGVGAWRATRSGTPVSGLPSPYFCITIRSYAARSATGDRCSLHRCGDLALSRAPTTCPSGHANGHDACSRGFGGHR